MASLIYDVLDASKSEIRLLKANFGLTGEIECELTTHSLDLDPEYHALSYVWGDASITTDILVNSKTFSTTTNLVAALRTLALHLNGKVLIWADAICINQQDDEERSSQVQVMSFIFKKAELVAAWLGPEEDQSTEVIELLKQLATEIEFSSNASVDIFSKLAP